MIWLSSHMHLVSIVDVGLNFEVSQCDAIIVFLSPSLMIQAHFKSCGSLFTTNKSISLPDLIILLVREASLSEQFV